MSQTMLKDLVEFVVKRLVDKPDAVSVTEISGEQATIVELRVAQEDLDRVGVARSYIGR